MKDLGHLSYFLGLEVHRSTKGIFVSQRKYIDDLLQQARHSECVPCSTSMNLKLSRDVGELEPDSTLYRRLVGSLIYLQSIRPDISYA
ncbi:hypothetical protein LINGRAHAP2_LOCUS32441, partial [Linum grandiflorum]